jgi:SAM-dependent methyltransferase
MSATRTGAPYRRAQQRPRGQNAAVGYMTQVFEGADRANRRAILDLLPTGRGGELLDIGVSDGSFTVEVARRLGVDAPAGLELIPAHAEAARSRGVDVTVGDAEDGLPYAAGRFATVHANQVIEHVRGTDRLLAEIHRVLAPGGLACISTNNLSSWHNVGALAAGWQPMPMHVSDEVIVGNPLNPEDGAAHADAGRVHLRLFTRRALSELCAHNGLRTVALRGAGYYPLPAPAARVAARLDPRHAAYVTGLFERA